MDYNVESGYKTYETIGHVNNISIEELKSMVGSSAENINLVLVLKYYEIEKPDASKIADINKKQLKKSKSNDWKTVKILKRLKALERYRIHKRLK